MTEKTLPASKQSAPARVSTRRAFEDILLQLEESLAANDLAAGDRLPPERELAAKFNVSRASVREALRVLEALGLVRVRRGADNGAVFLERPNNALEPLFRFHLALEHASVENLIEFRTVIEAWTVQAAAELRQPGPLADAEAALRGMKEGGREPPAFLPLDLEFHLAIARAAANPFAGLVLEGSRMAIERTMSEALGRAPRWTSVRRRLVREHGAILEAVRAGEGMKAADLMRRHIGGFYDDFLPSRALRRGNTRG
jgi:GntR family transcriptional regulator, transcriptional repressor for pyruvate dehydrogenase complex